MKRTLLTSSVSRLARINDTPEEGIIMLNRKSLNADSSEKEQKMHRKNLTFLKSVMNVVAVVLLAGTFGYAQRQIFQAQAMGQATQMGRSFSITMNIDEYSTPEDRNVLLEAFQEDGNRGLVNALDKMKSKGHLRITGTVGYNIAFVREIPSADGRKIRLITERPVRFGEAWHHGRSMDYQLTVLELDLNEDENKNSGVLMPLVEFKVDQKTRNLELKLFQNPWKLVNVQDRSEE